MLRHCMQFWRIFAGFINGWYYDDPQNKLVYWIQEHVFIRVWHSTKLGILLYVIFGGDPILGCHSKHFVPIGHILESLNFKNNECIACCFLSGAAKKCLVFEK
ncbi:unnamed protein product [Lathyrus oleraceus]